MSANIALDWGEIEVYSGRTEDLPFAIYDEDGVALGIAVTDVVRFKLASGAGATPTLDLDSVAASAQGSIVVISARGTSGSVPASGYVRIAQGETLTVKKYADCELALVDDSETSPADAIKVFGRGAIVVKASPGGDVGKT